MYILITATQVDIYADLKWHLLTVPLMEVEPISQHWSEQGWNIDYVGSSLEEAGQVLLDLQRYDIIAFSLYVSQFGGPSLDEILMAPCPRRLVVFTDCNQEGIIMINAKIYTMVMTMMRYREYFPEIRSQDQLIIPDLAVLKKIPTEFFRLKPPDEPATAEYQQLIRRLSRF